MSKVKAVKHFGASVAGIRRDRGLTQSGLAKKSKLHTTFISGVEKGERNITIETASKIARALNVSVAELFAEPERLKLKLPEDPVSVLFLKLGGTWDMQMTEEGLMGEGHLDDKAFAYFEREHGYDENKIAFALEKEFKGTQPVHNTIGKHLPWAPGIDELIEGTFLPLFSGDSSHYRPALIAPVLSFIFTHLYKSPNIQVVAGMGTDTVDVLLPFLDVFLFDKTGVPPVLFSGANLSYLEKGTDAPQNFYDLARATRLPLLPGAYYIFNKTIYKGGDFIKIDPDEAPVNLEGQVTFFSPHRTHTKIGFLGEGTVRRETRGLHIVPVPAYSTRELFDVINKIVSINLGNINKTSDVVERILDPRYPGVVIASHATGNAPYPIRNAVLKAVQKGKLVINVSRCITSHTSERYYVSLSSINHHELKGGGKQIIDGGRLNNNVAKALLTRALLEGLDQKQTQDLVQTYSARTF